MIKKDTRLRLVVSALVALTALVAISATAGAGTGATQQLNVKVLDGKITISATSFSPGKTTLVVVNGGKKSHGLQIVGPGVGSQKIGVLGIGKTIRLTVTLKNGIYQVWDPLQRSAKHTTFHIFTPAASSSSAKKSATTGSHSSSGSGALGGATDLTKVSTLCGPGTSDPKCLAVDLSGTNPCGPGTADPSCGYKDCPLGDSPEDRTIEDFAKLRK